MRPDSPDPKRSGLNANGSGLRSGLHLVGMGSPKVRGGVVCYCGSAFAYGGGRRGENPCPWQSLP